MYQNKTFVNKDGGSRDKDQLCEEEIPGAKLEKEIEKFTRPDALRCLKDSGRGNLSDQTVIELKSK